MIKYTKNNNIIIPTGDTLREEIAERGITQKELAIRLGMSDKAVNQIMQGIAPVTIETAMKLEKVLGISSSFIMNLENNYQIQKQKREEKELEIQEKRILKEYSVCYSTLANYNYVDNSKKTSVRADSLRRFFGVTNLLQIDMLGKYYAAYRKNTEKDINKYSLACWLRTGEIEAEKLNVANFDKRALKNVAAELSELTRFPVREYSKRIVVLCAQAGVKVVYTPYLKNTYVNGAVRWIGKNPVIQLSTRYPYADTLWFTLMHEIAHILKHSKNLFVDFQGESGNGEEGEADSFAQNILLENETYEKFRDKGDYSYEAIKSFSEKNNIHMGILAGRLANDESVKTFVYKNAAPYRKKIQLSPV